MILKALEKKQQLIFEPFFGYRGEVGLPVHQKTRQGSKMWWLQSETPRGE